MGITIAGALVMALALGGCAPAVSPGPVGAVDVVLTVGPVCPVLTDPPRPECAPQPLAGEVVAVVWNDREVARATSDADGRIRFELPHGRYLLQPIEDGVPPTAPAPLDIEIGLALQEINLEYDSGIR